MREGSPWHDGRGLHRGAVFCSDAGLPRRSRDAAEVGARTSLRGGRERRPRERRPREDLLDGRRASPHLVLLFPFLVQVAAKCCQCGVTKESCEAAQAGFPEGIWKVQQPPPTDEEAGYAICEKAGYPKAGNNGVCPAAVAFPPPAPPKPPMPPGPPPTSPPSTSPPPWYETVFAHLPWLWR